MFYLITILLTVIIWYFYELSKRQTRIVSPGIQLNFKLPHSQEWTLYHNQFALCSKKIRVCLAEYAINYKALHIDLIETGRYEKITRDFLAIPPAATVPVLLHNGHPIYESHGQIKFLAEQVDTKNLLVPTDEPLTIIMNKWIKKSSLLGDKSIKDTKATAGHAAAGLTLPIFAAMISHISGHKIIEGLLFHRIKKKAVFF